MNCLAGSSRQEYSSCSLKSFWRIQSGGNCHDLCSSKNVLVVIDFGSTAYPLFLVGLAQKAISDHPVHLGGIVGSPQGRSFSFTTKISDGPHSYRHHLSYSGPCSPTMGIRSGRSQTTRARYHGGN